MIDIKIEPGTLCLVWNNPEQGELPRYSIRVYDRRDETTHRTKFIDDHDVYWDNIAILPIPIADRLESFIRSLNE